MEIRILCCLQLGGEKKTRIRGNVHQKVHTTKGVTATGSCVREVKRKRKTHCSVACELSCLVALESRPCGLNGQLDNSAHCSDEAKFCCPGKPPLRFERAAGRLMRLTLVALESLPGLSIGSRIEHRFPGVDWPPWIEHRFPRCGFASLD